MARKPLEAELALLTELVGMLRTALEQKHCAPDCKCRTTWQQVSYPYYPYTISTTGNLWPVSSTITTTTTNS